MLTKTWLFQSTDDYQNAVVIVRSGYKNGAKKKLIAVVNRAAALNGQGLLKWVFKKLTEEEEKKVLAKFEVDTLYELDARELEKVNA